MHVHVHVHATNGERVNMQGCKLQAPVPERRPLNSEKRGALAPPNLTAAHASAQPAERRW